MAAVFSKLLRKTDIDNRLSIPTKCLNCLPSFKGGHALDFQAIDENGNAWTFKCSIRKKGHPKPVISKGWLAFVASKRLKFGDKIKFYKEINAATATDVYRVRAEKEIKIFGAIFGYAPLKPHFQ